MPSTHEINTAKNKPYSGDWYPSKQEKWKIENRERYSSLENDFLSILYQKNEDIISKEWDISTRDYSYPETLYIASLNNSESVHRKFSTYLRKWKKETQFTSSVTKIVGSEFFLKIISLGPLVITGILKEIQIHPSFLFYALQLISGENPANPEKEGDIAYFCQCWVVWGQEKGLI